MFFWVAAAVLVAWILSRIFTKSSREALWATWWVVLLICPDYLHFQPGVLTVNLRFLGVFIALTGVAVLPGRGGFGFGRPVPADGVELLLVSAAIISEYKMGRFSPLTVPEILRIWLFPYIVGRIFFRTTADVAAMMPAFAKACTYASVYAMIESVIKFNPVNKLLGKTYGLLEQGEGYRMGLKRAQGAQDHPIFMGLVLVLILPWAFEASQAAKEGRGPRWWRFIPWLVAGALFGTVSRGPQISALVATYLAFFFRFPKHRKSLLVLGLVIGAAAYGGKALILELSAKISNESEEPIRLITINGEEEEYTGTRHRILLFKAYGEYLDNAGMWGYGFAMRKVQLEEKLAQRFGSIDSAYIMLYLQRGYAGIVTFVALSVVTLHNLLWVAWPAKKPQAALAGALFASVLMLDLALFTSWFSPDFGAAFLFTTGVSARLASLPVVAGPGRVEPLESAAESPAPRRRFELVTGHPPIRSPEVAS